MKSSQKLRKTQLPEIARIIENGCGSGNPTVNKKPCGADVTYLKYGNGGYGEPWWEGFCPKHKHEMEGL